MICQWVIGLIAISLFGGFVLAGLLVVLLHAHISRNAKSRSEDGELESYRTDVPNWIIGFAERLFFTVLTAFDASGLVPGMMAWIALKMGANWLVLVKEEKNRTIRSFLFAGLLGSLCSLLCAYLGGLVCRGDLWP